MIRKFPIFYGEKNCNSKIFSSSIKKRERERHILCKFNIVKFAIKLGIEIRRSSEKGITGNQREKSYHFDLKEFESSQSPHGPCRCAPRPGKIEGTVLMAEPELAQVHLRPSGTNSRSGSGGEDFGK